MSSLVHAASVATRVLAAGLLLAAVAPSQATEPVLEAKLITAGLTAPSWICSPPGESNRLFVLELPGRVRLVKNGVLQATSFLDITDKAEQGAQSGLMGMVFHPDYANNGWFYLYYAINGNSSTLERYSVSAGNPDLADAGSALAMLSAPIVDPVQFHMGGGMDFGPDGKLYVAIGDIREVPTATCASQRLNTLLGKVLRLNDDGSVPSDNPFVGVAGARPEIWDLGLREPFRLKFDPPTGDMYIGDVGEASREEVNLHPATTPGGMNFGWRVMEGELCTGATQCAAYPCPSTNYTLPIHAFPHQNDMCCILGGGVYRGASVPALQGAYVYGEYCTGAVYSLRMQGGVVTGNQKLSVLMPAGGVINQLVQVGVDVAGELFMLDLGSGGVGAGEIWRLGRPELTNLGGALGGALGSPAFSGLGAAKAGQMMSLNLAQALPAAPAYLFAGIGLLNLPFKGGVMVPRTDFILTGLHVGANGTLPLSFTWPGGLPAGTLVALQWWLVDPSGPVGFTASNALKAVTL